MEVSPGLNRGGAPKRLGGGTQGLEGGTYTKEECPACGKEKVNREGWSAERSHDGHSSGPPTPVQPAGGVTVTPAGWPDFKKIRARPPCDWNSGLPGVTGKFRRFQCF